MKVRFGFVSNSSSTAFVLCGIKLTDEQYKKLLKQGEDGDWDQNALWKGLHFLSEEKMFGVLRDIDDDCGPVRTIDSETTMNPDVVSKKIEKIIGKPVKAQFFYGRRCT